MDVTVLDLGIEGADEDINNLENIIVGMRSRTDVNRMSTNGDIDASDEKVLNQQINRILDRFWVLLGHLLPHIENGDSFRSRFLTRPKNQSSVSIDWVLHELSPEVRENESLRKAIGNLLVIDENRNRKLYWQKSGVRVGHTSEISPKDFSIAFMPNHYADGHDALAEAAEIAIAESQYVSTILNSVLAEIQNFHSLLSAR